MLKRYASANKSTPFRQVITAFGRSKKAIGDSFLSFFAAKPKSVSANILIDWMMMQTEGNCTLSLASGFARLSRWDKGASCHSTPRWVSMVGMSVVGDWQAKSLQT